VRRHSGLLLLGLPILLFMGGCASTLPDVPALMESTTITSPQIVGSGGKLTPARSRAILSREQQGAHAEELIEKTVAFMEVLSGHPLTAGNKISLLVDGPATYDAMLKAIGEARDHINFETFIFSDDEVGQEFAELLMRKQGEGVQVNLIYDAVGSMNTPSAFFQRLRDAGVNVLEFNPIDPFSILNREMTEEDIKERLDHYGIPTDLPLLVQISRFDRWKDPQGVIEAFKIARREVDATLVLLGNAAISRSGRSSGV
jgi:hypothetical protein